MAGRDTLNTPACSPWPRHKVDWRTDHGSALPGARLQLSPRCPTSSGSSPSGDTSRGRALLQRAAQTGDFLAHPGHLDARGCFAGLRVACAPLHRGQLRLQAGVALAQAVDFSLQPPLAAPVAQSC